MDRRKRKSMLELVAGACFLLSGLRFFYLHGFPSGSDGRIDAGLELLVGSAFLMRSMMDMRNPRQS